jgi:hypothetical protein
MDILALTITFLLTGIIEVNIKSLCVLKLLNMPGIDVQKKYIGTIKKIQLGMSINSPIKKGNMKNIG